MCWVMQKPQYWQQLKGAMYLEGHLQISKRCAQISPRKCPWDAQTMHKIFTRYAQCMPKICPRYALDNPRYSKDMSKIYAQDMSKICPRYAWDIPEICPMYAQDMPKMCPTYAQFMHHICPRYALDMPKICDRYSQDEPKICLRYAWGMPEIILAILVMTHYHCQIFIKSLSNLKNITDSRSLQHGSKRC